MWGWGLAWKAYDFILFYSIPLFHLISAMLVGWTQDLAGALLALYHTAAFPTCYAFICRCLVKLNTSKPPPNHTHTYCVRTPWAKLNTMSHVTLPNKNSKCDVLFWCVFLWLSISLSIPFWAYWPPCLCSLCHHSVSFVVLLKLCDSAPLIYNSCLGDILTTFSLIAAFVMERAVEFSCS